MKTKTQIQASDELMNNLKEQHQSLVRMLTDIKIVAEVDPPDIDKIVTLLVVFQSAILEHFKFEVKVFYPELFILMEQSGKSTEEPRQFLGKMAGIFDKLALFLGTYENKQKLVGRKNDFLKDLNDVTEILSARLKAEEDEVYKDYQILKTQEKAK